jgi:hypothetical protein
MQVPQFYEHIRSARQAKTDLQDLARTPHVLKGHLLSEDLLIRSHHESVTNILPFLT